jgi:hypothetical protein
MGFSSRTGEIPEESKSRVSNIDLIFDIEFFF